MNNTFLKSPRQAAARTVLITVAVITLAAAGVVWLVGRSSGQQPAALPAPSALTSTAPAAPASPAPALALVRGQNLVDGISVGYPHELAGAVSAAAQAWEQVGSTLDLDRARAVGRALCDDSWGDAGARMAQGVQATRVNLGAPPAGPVPVSVSTILEVEAYQVRDSSPDRMTVLLLGYRTTSGADGHITTGLSVFPSPMVWRDGDWKVADRGENAPDFADLRQQPGTAAAQAAGWQGLTR